MKAKPYSISEYGVIRKASDFDYEASDMGKLYLPDDAFDSIYKYILSNQPLEGDIPFSLFSKGKKMQIKVRNYVGIIETSDGISLEILPKVCQGKSEKDLAFTRMIFLKMLGTLKDTPFVSINAAHISTRKNFPILEAFISSYVDEAEKLFGTGVKADYVLKDDNLNFLKGKLLVTENIKYNFINHAKFYCGFSELSEDIPQNRIIKSTILKLLKTTSSYSNYSQLNKLLTHLEGVKSSNSLLDDLRKCFVHNRLFKPYTQLLEWSKIFLLNNGFTNFKGDSLNIAVLFPMERIFESYIVHQFRKFTTGYQIKAQDKRYFLVQSHKSEGRFRLRPDIYLTGGEVQQMIVDTKWKLIDETKPSRNYEIKIADMYQLFAYGKKYSDGKSIPSLVTIYPKNDFFNSKLEPFIYEETLELNIFPFDFERNEKEQIAEIVSYVLSRNKPKH